MPLGHIDPQPFEKTHGAVKSSKGMQLSIRNSAISGRIRGRSGTSGEDPCSITPTLGRRTIRGPPFPPGPLGFSSLELRDFLAEVTVYVPHADRKPELVCFSLMHHPQGARDHQLFARGQPGHGTLCHHFS
jgi:hypothetical protein